LFIFAVDDKVLIISLFIFGIITDLLDGSVARGLNKVTEFGAMLDPLADRILIFPIAVYSLYKLHWGLLIVWLLTEIVNASFSTFYKSKEAYIESNIYGKTKMALWCVVFLAILIVWPKTPSIIFIDIVWISIIISFLSIFTKFLEMNNKGHIKNKIITKKI
jgi:CDP-diacylglycerol--glycerol-3-phosphate 3-phosphatidyltransferase